MAIQIASCPSKDMLTAHGLGKLDAASAAAVDAHLETCVDCRRVVAKVPVDSFIGRLRAAHDQYSTIGSGEPVAAATRNSEPEAPIAQASGQSEIPLSAEPRQSMEFELPNFTCPKELENHPDFELIKELGRGGMGVVYLARHRTMGRLEVLKVVNKARLDGPGTMKRFLQEIRAAARLSHTNIVAAHSVLRAGGLLVFSMEYVDGEDLLEFVKRRGPLPVANATFYAHQVALGLQHALESEMVHRDIKPNNLMLIRVKTKHVIKILDFGLAKATSEHSFEGGLTNAGQMLGTPGYMSPEQWCDAQKADIRADIYSLGCTLYFMLTGEPPFTGSLPDLMEAHQTGQAKAVNLVRPDVPAELAVVVAKMMAKAPAERYQTPAEVSAALGPFFKLGPQQTSKADLPAVAPAGTNDDESARKTDVAHAANSIVTLNWPSSENWRGMTQAAPRSGRRLRLLIAVGLLFVGLLGGGALYHRLTTAEATVVVRVDVPNPEIVVNGEKPVTWEDGGKTAKFRVRPGSTKIELKQDGFKDISETIDVRAAGHAALMAHFVPHHPSPAANDRP